MSQPITFIKALKGGFITGMIAAGINNLWSLVAQATGSVPPPGFPVAVILSSIFPIMIGAILYFILAKFSLKGHVIFTVISVIFTLLASLYIRDICYLGHTAIFKINHYRNLML